MAQKLWLLPQNETLEVDRGNLPYEGVLGSDAL